MTFLLIPFASGGNNVRAMNPTGPELAKMGPQVPIRGNVNPGLINPWLINRGVSPFSGDSDHFWRGFHPPSSGTGST